MSLATRCAACGTVFRVVQDQLRVSSGWVRCGRCGEVFNAIESLVDLEIDRPGDGGPPSVHGARVMEDLARVAAKGGPAAASALQAVAGDGGRGEAGPGPQPAPRIRHDEGTEDVAVPSQRPAAEPAWPDPTGEDAGKAAAGPPLWALHPPASEALDRASEPPGANEVSSAASRRWDAPTFVRQADRAARWRHPAVRALLSLLAVLALALLGWQMSLTHHDWMAARWPGLAPVLEQVCVVGGCSIEPPRRIDKWAVDSSGLVRSGAPGRYRLTAALRNRDAIALRVPALDLVLTDALGTVIARRVLAASDLGAASAKVEAGGDLALAATLEISGAPVVGYTIELFYP